jgi:hypothetical protein
MQVKALSACYNPPTRAAAACLQVNGEKKDRTADEKLTYPGICEYFMHSPASHPIVMWASPKKSRMSSSAAGSANVHLAAEFKSDEEREQVNDAGPLISSRRNSVMSVTVT